MIYKCIHAGDDLVLKTLVVMVGHHGGLGTKYWGCSGQTLMNNLTVSRSIAKRGRQTRIGETNQFFVLLPPFRKKRITSVSGLFSTYKSNKVLTQAFFVHFSEDSVRKSLASVELSFAKVSFKCFQFFELSFVIFWY